MSTGNAILSGAIGGIVMFVGGNAVLDQYHKIIAKEEKQLTDTITQTQPDALRNTHGNTIGWEMAQFLSAKKSTGIPDAMMSLLAPTQHDDTWRLELINQENFPVLKCGSCYNDKNTKHAFLALRRESQIHRENANPEGIVAFFDFTRVPGGQSPAQLIVYSELWNRGKHGGDQEVWELTNDNKLLNVLGNGGTFPVKDIINQAYVE